MLSRELPKVGGKFIQMEDEIASMAACIIGASVGGLKSMTATSGPGFSLMQEQSGYAVMTEVPCVVVNVQRLGPAPAADQRLAGRCDAGPLGHARRPPHHRPQPDLGPQAFDLTVKAFNFSEKYRTPVILLTDEVIGHMRERSTCPISDTSRFERTGTERAARMVQALRRLTPAMCRPWPNFGDGYRYHITGLFHDEMGYPTQRLDEIDPGSSASTARSSATWNDILLRRRRAGRARKTVWSLTAHRPQRPPRRQAGPPAPHKVGAGHPADHLALRRRRLKRWPIRERISCPK
jgi:2-oxoglutarate/2-oxoacid ferredoxin oxidoreductase subunit alpha